MLTLMFWLAAGADEYYQEWSKEWARLNETIRDSVKIIADFHQSGFFNERTCSTYLLRVWSPSENNNHFLQKMVTHECFYYFFSLLKPNKVRRWVWSLIRNNVGVYTAPPPIHSHPNSGTLSPRKVFSNILFPFRIICFCQDIIWKILWLFFCKHLFVVSNIHGISVVGFRV